MILKNVAVLVASIGLVHAGYNCISKKPPKPIQFYVGAGIGAQYAMHNYTFRDIGEEVGQPLVYGAKKLKAISPQVKILGGFRYNFQNQWFCGAGLESSFGRNEVSYETGSFYPGLAFYNTFVPAKYTIRQNYDMQAKLHVGRWFNDYSIIGQIGVVKTHFHHSFQTRSVYLSKTNTDFKSYPFYGFVYGVGGEKKIASNLTFGFDLCVSHFKKLNHKVNFIEPDGEIYDSFNVSNGHSKNISITCSIKKYI